MNYGNPALTGIRSVARRLGVLAPIKRLYLTVFKPQYEQQFDVEMLKEVRPGDIVWDVGANVGFFSQKFAMKVGDQGAVHAFEPSPQTCSTLRTNCSALLNVHCHNVALSNVSGSLPFVVSSNLNDPTNQLAGPGFQGTTVSVAVHTGDELIARGVAHPNAIKIDVEGFEVEVLRGLETTLAPSPLRAVFVEVHFAQLSKRRVEAGPAEIVDRLSQSGFDVRWVDSSHIIAVR